MLLIRAVFFGDNVADFVEVEAAQLVRWALSLEHLLELEFLDERVFLLEDLSKLQVFVFRRADLLVLVLDHLDHLSLILHKLVDSLHPVVILAAIHLAVVFRERVQRVPRVTHPRRMLHRLVLGADSHVLPVELVLLLEPVTLALVESKYLVAASE